MTRAGVSAFALLALWVGFPSGASAGQSGGSIYYGDSAASRMSLEFKARVWHVRGDYYRATADYRETETNRWRDLDSNWCWTRRCALREMIEQARFLARDGYIWRFEEPRRAPSRADHYRFSEADFREGTGRCARRLVRGLG